MAPSKPTAAFPIPTKSASDGSGIPQHADAESSNGTPSSYITTGPSSYADSPSAMPARTKSKKGKGKAKAVNSSSATSFPTAESSSSSSSPLPPTTTPQTPPNNARRQQRRNSLYFDPNEDGLYRYDFLSPSFQQRDEICVNVGTDEHPRLVALIASAQGYEFNKANFLPPRFLREYGGRGGYDFEAFRGVTEVVDIVVTEEERREMFME